MIIWEIVIERTIKFLRFILILRFKTVLIAQCAKSPLHTTEYILPKRALHGIFQQLVF